MKLDLPSLVYHDREWFVFRQVLSHLPKEKAALAGKRSKENRKYTSRLGISKEWVVGERKVKLIQNGFIEDVVLDSALIFSNILIVRENFEELLRESFSRALTLNVEQYTLTEKLFVMVVFEWNYDPKQNDPAKQIKITHTDQSSPSADKKQPKKEKKGSTPRRKTLPSKRKKGKGCEDSEDSATDSQSSDQFTISVSENVLLRPKRKKVKQATNLSRPMVENGTKPKDGIIENRIEQNKSTTSTVSENKNLCLEQDNKLEMPNTVCTLSMNTSIKEKTPVKDEAEIPLSLPSLFDNLLSKEDGDSQSILSTGCEKNHEMNNEDNSETKTDCPVDEQNVDNSISQTIPSSSSPEYSLLDGTKPTQSSDTITNNSVMLNLSLVNDEVSPSTLVQNLKKQEKQLCSEIDDIGSETSTCNSIDPNDSEETAQSFDVGEVESSCNNNEESIKDHTDHNDNCTASVCSCPNQHQCGENPETVNNTEAKLLLSGLIATGLVSQVRELLENVNCGDKKTKVSQMEDEIKTLQKKICQQKKANQQMEKNVRRRAKELQKSFDDLKAGKAECLALEEKCQAVQTEKTAVEGKLKKCLEVLSSIG